LSLINLLHRLHVLSVELRHLHKDVVVDEHAMRVLMGGLAIFAERLELPSLHSSRASASASGWRSRWYATCVADLRLGRRGRTASRPGATPGGQAGEVGPDARGRRVPR